MPPQEEYDRTYLTEEKREAPRPLTFRPVGLSASMHTKRHKARARVIGNGVSGVQVGKEKSVPDALSHKAIVWPKNVYTMQKQNEQKAQQFLSEHNLQITVKQCRACSLSTVHGSLLSVFALTLNKAYAFHVVSHVMVPTLPCPLTSLLIPLLYAAYVVAHSEGIRGFISG